ncbi:MAG: hypothetical protein AB7P69_17710 [Candidatus Binatia bacterium]
MWRAAVEEDAEVHRQLIKQTKEIPAIALVGIAKRGTGHLFEDLEAFGLVPLTDRLHDEITLLRQANGGQTVQHGEGLLTRKAVYSSFRAVLVIRMRSDEILDALAQQCGGAQSGVIQIAQLIERGNRALLRDAIDALELLPELVGNEVASLTDEGC